HQPELVPLAPDIRGVDYPPSVSAPVGSRLPGGLLIPNLPRRPAAALPRGHPPDGARSPDVPPVGDRQQLGAVRRPGRREILIHRVVVVPGQAALAVLAHPGDALRVAVAGDL